MECSPQIASRLLGPACEDGRERTAAARRRNPSRHRRAWPRTVAVAGHPSVSPPTRRMRHTRRSRGVTVKDNVVAPLAPVTTEGSLADLPGRNAAESPAAAAFARKGAGGQWSPITWREFAADVDAVAKGLIAAGVEPGGRVASCRAPATSGPSSTSRPGAPAPSSCRSTRPPPPSRCEWILSDSGTVVAIVETSAHRSTIGLVEGGPARPQGRRRHRGRRASTRCARRVPRSATTSSPPVAPASTATPSPRSSTRPARRAGPRAAS